MRWLPFLLPITCVLLTGAAIAQAGVPIDPLDGVTVLGSVAVAGNMYMDASEGAMRIEPNVLSSALLMADHVEIEVSWERGYDVGNDESLFQVVAQRGEEKTPLDDVSVRFEEYQGQPLLLPFAEEGQADLSLGSLGGWSIAAVEDVTVAGVGASPDGVGAGEAENPAFWYDAEGPVVQAAGPGTVQVEGSFSLFVHNLVIDADAGGTQWSDWTGRWESDPGLPVTEYEFRVTTIHVRNGTFLMTSMQDMAFYGPGLDGRVDGSVNAAAVTGRLLRGDEVLVFDQDPLRLQGSGPLSLQAIHDSARHDRVRLLMEPSGDFDVRGAGTIETVDAPGSSGWGVVVFSSLGGLMLLGGAAMGLGYVGLVPVPTKASRELRYKRWMGRGQRSTEDNRFERAAYCYEKATRVKRDEPLAWFAWAHAELEAGHADKAEAVALKAQDVPGIDLLDLLDLRTCAAWQRGDWPAFEDHLACLAEKSPEMAQGLLHDLEVDSSRLGTRVRAMFRAGRQGGELDGYV